MFYLVLACRCILVSVFVLSAAGKTRRPGQFVSAVGTFRLLPAALVRPAAYVFLAAEIVAAGLLCVPATLSIGFLLSAALLLAFTGAIAQAVVRGLNIPCPCFGVSVAPVGLRHIVRDVFLVFAAVVGILGPQHGTLAAGGIAVSLGAAAVVVLLVRFTDELAELFDPR
ncbi:MauE/DoxX family redox-associated membrane protein [Streptacidiphilus pinicola]|uniref:MauE/DoxX family redox-associated membrane protein n=1 Tax=Streptacidiphilus pinicola TaxID=2219663 RepID=UPI001403E384|nr:MauE/DoxX family redox-associated membrane protein [Streptacidiphilus pinicola]